jgi:hypothetical protein
MFLWPVVALDISGVVVAVVWDVAVFGFLAQEDDVVFGEGSVIVATAVSVSDSGRLRFFLANRSCLRRSLRVTVAVVVVVSMAGQRN